MQALIGWLYQRGTHWLAATILAVAMSPVMAAAVSSDGGLRDRVPDYATAYLRIPGPWAALESWQGPGMRSVNADPQIQAALAKLRFAISAELSPLGDGPAALVDFVLTQMRSPLEAIVLMVPVNGRPQLTVVLSVELSFSATADVNTYIRRLTKSHPSVALMNPIATNRPGLLQFDKASALLAFEPATGRLNAVISPQLEPRQAETLLRLPQRQSTPIAALEREVDTTGNGLFLWLNGRTALPYMQLMAPPDELLKLQLLGLLDARAFAIGLGSAGGKGRARLAVDIPRSGLLELIPVSKTRVDLHAAGVPNFVAVINGLEADTPERIERAVTELGELGQLAEMRKARAELHAAMGFDVVGELFHSVGPELVYFSDDAGDFTAVELRDAARFQQLLLNLSASPFMHHSQHQIRGVKVHHLIYRPKVSTVANESEDDAAERWLGRANTVHFYFAEEGQYLLFAAVPQALADRHRAETRTSLANWLARNAGPQFADSAALLSLRVNHIPRTSYYYMLQAIQLLADVSSAPVDLFALPSAYELNLPKDGAVTWRLELSNERIAAELTFDGTPLDLLAAPGAMTTAAVIGVLAAVAIPAYQDYHSRAAVQVAYEGVVRAYATKTRLSAGRPPPAGTQFKLSPASEVHVQSTVVTEGGDVLIVLRQPSQLAGQTLRLRPREPAPNNQSFKCVGDEVLPKFFPRACR
jgi:hypothetical protein